MELFRRINESSNRERCFNGSSARCPGMGSWKRPLGKKLARGDADLPVPARDRGAGR